MLEIVNVRIDSLDLDYLDLSWEIKSTPENILKFDFEIYRSEAHEGPYTKVAGPFKDRYSFRDNIVPRRHEWRTFHYKISIINSETQEEVVFGPFTPNPRPTLDGLEIIRQETLLFKEFIGRPCLLLPVRSFGQDCGCIDKVSGRRLIGSCPNCYGSGFLYGFHSPTLVYAQIDPFPKSQQNTPVATSQQAMTTGRITSFPLIKPRDILIEKENRRWRVAQVMPTERLRAVIRQELQLTKITVGDIEYGIPVQWPDIETSPRSYNIQTDI